MKRAESRTRTGDLFITNELLYQLSYFGKNSFEKTLFLNCDAKVVLLHETAKLLSYFFMLICIVLDEVADYYRTPMSLCVCSDRRHCGCSRQKLTASLSNSLFRCSLPVSQGCRKWCVACRAGKQVCCWPL